MNRLRRVSMATVWLLTAMVCVSHASVAPAWSIDELTEFSKAVVSGRVVDVGVGRDVTTDAIYTYVTVSVGEVLKGDISERTITIKQLGGESGNEGLRVAGQATFVIGEDVLLFLEVRPRDGTLYTSALWQGKWSIERNGTTGEQMASRYDLASSERGPFRGDPERAALSSVFARVRERSRVGKAPDAARRFQMSPPDEELATVVHGSSRLRPDFVLQTPPIRWSEVDTGMAIPVDVQAGGQPGAAQGGANEITSAFGLWTAVTPLVFAGAGSSTGCSGQGTSDGHISIVFMDPCGEMDDTGGTLAASTFRYSFSGGRTINGVSFVRAIAGSVINNNSSTALKYLTNSGCFQAVQTHEIGHVLGLAHSADPNAIMYPSMSSACLSSTRGLGSDDIAGIQSIYPDTSDPPAATPRSGAPGAPTGLTTSASGVFVTMTWRAPTTGGAPTGYQIESGSSTGLSNIASFATGSGAPSFSADKVGVNTYYVRVRAINSVDAGPASNESILVVR